MYCVTVLFEVLSQHRTAFRARVARQAEDSLREETGCHRFDVWTDPARPDRVYLYEVYQDRAAFETHLASPHFKAFDQEVACWVSDKTVALWQDQL